MSLRQILYFCQVWQNSLCLTSLYHQFLITLQTNTNTAWYLFLLSFSSFVIFSGYCWKCCLTLLFYPINSFGNSFLCNAVSCFLIHFILFISIIVAFRYEYRHRLFFVSISPNRELDGFNLLHFLRALSFWFVSLDFTWMYMKSTYIREGGSRWFKNWKGRLQRW